MSDDKRSKPARTARPARDEEDVRKDRNLDDVDEQAVVRFEDPRMIRALAHPARMAIIDALASGDELTATDCAALTGLTPSATAYHLNFLERFGFAEPAPPRPDGRHRPWRATSRGTRVDLDNSTPAAAAASSAVAAAHFDASRALALGFTESSYAEPAPWRDAGILFNADVWLTADEVEGLGEQLHAIVEPYRGRDRADGRPEGSRRVRVMNMVVPHPHRRPQVTTMPPS